MQQEFRYRADIDGLRAIAVLAVIAFHAGWIPGGFVGVDVFFVISGYLISGIIFRNAGKPHLLKNFYFSRIKRIFPALLLVLLACWLCGQYVLLEREFRPLGKHIAGGATFLSNFLLFGEANYFDTASDLKPLLHLWSLGIEEQFYIVWPALVLLIMGLDLRFIAFVALLLGASLVADIKLIQTDPAATFYLPFSRFWELLLGSMLAWAEYRGATAVSFSAQWLNRLTRARSLGLNIKCEEWISNVLSMVGLLLIVGSVLLFDRNQPYPGKRALVPTVGAFLSIAAGETPWLNRRFLAQKPVVYVGLISYPLYLWHWPLLSFVRTVEPPPDDVRLIACAVTLAVLLAYATYEWVEKPIRFGLHSIPLRKKVAALAATMASVAILGGAIFTGNLVARDSGYRMTSDGDHPWLGLLRRCDAKLLGLNDDDTCYVSAVQVPNEPIDVVIGDSHAWAFARGAGVLNSDMAVWRKNFVVISRPGCPPFWGVERFKHGVSQHCDVEEVVGRATQGRTVNNVYLVGRYAFYASGEASAVEGTMLPGYVEIRKTGDASSVGARDFPSVLEYGLTKTLYALADKAKTVTLVLQVPELDFTPESCVRPVRLLQRKCSISRSEVDLRQSSYREAFARTVLKFPSVKVFDPLSLLCSAEKCSAIEAEERKLLYFDNNHLSPYGSAKLLSALLPPAS